MTTLHPHWQSTDDADDRAVPIRIRSAKKTPRSAMPDHDDASSGVRSPVRAARRPAAFAGIFLFFIAGAAALQGYGLFALEGQVNPPGVTVRLSPSGAVPVTITVEPGSTITWTNDDTIPHVLSSETLPTDDGKMFVTSAIFPGSSTHILVPLNAETGAYPYISKTSDTVSGQIIVKSGVDMEPYVPPVAVVSPASSSAPSSSSVAFSNPETVMPAATITQVPVNPYTVGSGNAPLPERQAAGNPSISAHTPFSTPETGPAVWIAIVSTLGLLLLLTRGAFRSL